MDDKPRNMAEILVESLKGKVFMTPRVKTPDVVNTHWTGAFPASGYKDNPKLSYRPYEVTDIRQEYTTYCKIRFVDTNPPEEYLGCLLLKNILNDSELTETQLPDRYVCWP